jgi:hypothetical protein
MRDALVERAFVHVSLPEFDGTARCRLEVRVVMQDDKTVMGSCRAYLQVNGGKSLVEPLLCGAPLQSLDPGASGFGNSSVYVELVEHSAVRLVFLEIPRGPPELCSLRVAALDIALDRCLPPSVVESPITEHPPEGGGVH